MEKFSKKIKFNNGKKCVLIALSSVVALSLISCDASRFKNDNSNDTHTQTMTDTSIISINTESSDVQDSSSIESDTLPEETLATENINNVGDVLINDSNLISLGDFNRIYENSFCNGNFRIGFDNPEFINYLRQFYGDDTLTIDDLCFVQAKDMVDDPDSGYSVPFVIEEYSQYGGCVDIIRYILSQNGLRMWIDEIPYSFFEECFPDYVSIYNSSSGDDFVYSSHYIPNYDNIEDAFRGCNETSISRVLSSDDSQQMEAFRRYVFNVLCKYNYYRYSVATIDSKLIGYIPIRRSVDGKVVLAPSGEQYRKLQNQTERMYKCENLDISKAETFDDLINSGVDVDAYTLAFEKAGIKTVATSLQEDNQQRSLG